MSISVTLTQACSAFQASFLSLDIRAAVKRHPPAWLSLLTAIRISVRPVDLVQRRYSELERTVPRPHADPFRILFDARPFTDLDQILTELSNGHLTVQGETVQFPQALVLDQLQGRVERFQPLVNPWAQEIWPALYCPFGTRSVPFQHPQIMPTVRQLGWQSPEATASHFLELNLQQLYSINIPLFFYIEMPAWIRVNPSGKQALVIEVMVERNLQGIHFFVAMGTSSAVPKELPLQPVGDDGPFTIFRALPSSGDARVDDDFSCTLTHDKLPIVDEVHGKLRHFLVPAEVNPLLICLKQFWDMERFRQRVEQPHQTEPKKRERKVQWDFQESMAHLLTLAGFQALDLGKEEVLRGKSKEVVRGTLDILAYYAPSKLLVLGACTLAPPKPEDIDRLLETKAVLRGLFPDDTSIRFIPMIFSAQETEAMSHQEVRVLNSKKLSILWKLVEDRNEDKFLNALQWPFGDGLDGV
jgi:hypothetical protein